MFSRPSLIFSPAISRAKRKSNSAVSVFIPRWIQIFRPPQSRPSIPTSPKSKTVPATAIPNAPPTGKESPRNIFRALSSPSTIHREQSGHSSEAASLETALSIVPTKPADRRDPPSNPSFTQKQCAVSACFPACMSATIQFASLMEAGPFGLRKTVTGPSPDSSPLR